MYLARERANELNSAVWMIGLGLLLYTGYWWPGILFVAGASSLVEGLTEGKGWYALQGTVWVFGLAIWFATGTSVGMMFVLLGIGSVLSALLRPSTLAHEPKPVFDNYLE